MLLCLIKKTRIIERGGGKSDCPQMVKSQSEEIISSVGDVVADSVTDASSDAAFDSLVDRIVDSLFDSL